VDAQIKHRSCLLKKPSRVKRRQLAPRAFPPAPELAALFDAAWNAYVIFNQPFTDVFAVLAALQARTLQTGQDNGLRALR
jgi:hypothetical protein